MVISRRTHLLDFVEWLQQGRDQRSHNCLFRLVSALRSVNQQRDVRDAQASILNHTHKSQISEVP